MGGEGQAGYDLGSWRRAARFLILIFSLPNSLSWVKHEPMKRIMILNLNLLRMDTI